MIFLKIIAIWATLFYCAFGNTLVEKLQEQFFNDVLMVAPYKKRFHTYLEKRCSDDSLCTKNEIKKLQLWEEVQNDRKLQQRIEKKRSLATIDPEYFSRLEEKLHKKNLPLQRSQFVTIADLQNQTLLLLLWENDEKKFYFIGQDLISTGDIEREIEIQRGEDHYLKTPAGVFKAHKGWRSDGKAHKDNEKILGYGKKDRFIFYFGLQETIRYNVLDQNMEKIYDKKQWKLIKDTLNLAAHAHHSFNSLGKVNSHGCIRMNDDLNRFLDNNFALHKPNLENGIWNHKYAHAPKEPQNRELAGEYFIVFDEI